MQNASPSWARSSLVFLTLLTQEIQMLDQRCRDVSVATYTCIVSSAKGFDRVQQEKSVKFLYHVGLVERDKGRSTIIRRNIDRKDTRLREDEEPRAGKK